MGRVHVEGPGMYALRVSIHLKDGAVEEGLLFKRIFASAGDGKRDVVQIWIKYDKTDIPNMYIKDTKLKSLRIVGPHNQVSVCIKTSEH
jgi:hypothetical protein